MTRISAPLVAFAYLAETAHETGHNLDLISALAPLLGIVASAHEGELFQPALLARELRDRFALRVNPYAVEQWIPKLKAAGILKGIPMNGLKGSKQVEKLTFSKPTGISGTLDESDVVGLVDQFLIYAKPRLARVDSSISDIDLETFFLREISDLDFLAAVLRTNKQARQKSTLTLKKDSTASNANLNDNADLDVLCAGFFLHASEEDPATFERIVKIASGAVISEVLFDVGNPQTNTSFVGQSILLDGPICIKALGLNSREDEEYTRELLNSLISRGAKLAVFEHTIDEVKSLLSAALKGAQEPWGYGPTVRRIRQDRMAETLARAILSDIESALRAVDVKIILSNPTTSSAWALLPQSQEELLAEQLSWYENPESRSRDAASLAATYRLRNGVRTSPKQVHEPRYLFVTENSRIVDVAYAFFSREPDAPVVVTDRYLAGYLFVMCGGADDITGLLKKRVLANCSNAVAPRTDLIEKMVGFVQNLDDDQRKKYTAMMTDGRAGRYLTEITFGNTGYLQADNFESVLEEIYDEAMVERTKALAYQKRNLEAKQAELLTSLDANHLNEVAAIQKEGDQKLLKMDEQLQKLAAEQEAKEKVENELGSARMQLHSALMNVADSSFFIGRIAYWLLHIVYFLVAGILAWISDLIPPTSDYRALYYIGSALLVILALHRMPTLLIDRPRTAITNWRYFRLVKERGLLKTAAVFQFDASSGSLTPNSKKTRE